MRFIKRVVAKVVLAVEDHDDEMARMVLRTVRCLARSLSERSLEPAEVAHAGYDQLVREGRIGSGRLTSAEIHHDGYNQLVHEGLIRG